ncbi:Methylamine utilisation protein MauE [Amycolatopsis xylanica]|uniref:Methylamine utilisation protein MauE n=1 Tax=Amycolatopsis xylanica TaxID=589385 RepID=A0A1H3P7K8_9PSEU|nr:MauE/DoxX family redox-associated membrane protein [Amycolatopsis xylanica]SDY96359.1 Methylamine utilisation protein MauE [Amycolatopsis xylanica]
MSYAELFFRAFLLGVFLFAVLGKARGRAAFEEFVLSLQGLRLTPRKWSAHLAALVVAAEAAVVVLLAVPGTVVAGFGLAAVLLIGMTGAIVVAIGKGRQAPCRCFGASVTPLGTGHVVRNLILLAASAGGLAFAGSTGATEPGGVVLALAAAAVGVLLVVRADDLMALFAVTQDSK